MQDIISDNNLDDEKAREFVKNAFRDGELKLEGQDFDRLIPKTSFFDSNRAELKEKVANILKEYYDKYSGILE